MPNNKSILEEDIHILKQRGQQESALRKAGIDTVGALISYSKADLLNIHNINITTINAICTQLERYNLHLNAERKSVKFDNKSFEGKIYYKLTFLINDNKLMEHYDEFLRKCENLELKAVLPLNEIETYYFRKKVGIIVDNNNDFLEQTLKELNLEKEYEIDSVICLKLAYNFLPKNDIVIIPDKNLEQVGMIEMGYFDYVFHFKKGEKYNEFLNIKSFASLTVNEFFSLFYLSTNTDLKNRLKAYKNIRNLGCNFADEEELIRINCYSAKEREEDLIKADSILIAESSLNNIVKNKLLRNGYNTFGDALRNTSWRDLSYHYAQLVCEEIHNLGFCLPEETKVMIIEKSKLEAKTINDLDLSVRLYNNLYRLGLITIGQITALSLKDLSDFRTMRQKDVYNLYGIIHGLGLKFKDEDKYNLEKIYKNKISFEGAYVIKVEHHKTEEESEQQKLQKEKEELLRKCRELNYCLEQEKQKIRELNDKLGETLSELASKTSKEEFSEIKKCFVNGESND